MTKRGKISKISRIIKGYVTGEYTGTETLEMIQSVLNLPTTTTDEKE